MLQYNPKRSERNPSLRKVGLRVGLPCLCFRNPRELHPAKGKEMHVQRTTGGGRGGRPGFPPGHGQLLPHIPLHRRATWFFFSLQPNRICCDVEWQPLFLKKERMLPVMPPGLGWGFENCSITPWKLDLSNVVSREGRLKSSRLCDMCVLFGINSKSLSGRGVCACVGPVWNLWDIHMHSCMYSGRRKLILESSQFSPIMCGPCTVWQPMSL